MRRSDYKRTIESLGTVFHSDNILYVFYERFFGEEHEVEVDRMNNFLGLDSYDSGLADERVNSSKSVELDLSMREFAMSQFKFIYNFIGDKFVDMPESWKKDMAL